MRYVQIVLLWLTLSSLWGLLGSLIGPGIVMLIIALLVGTLGALITVIQRLCGHRTEALRTGLLLATIGIILVGIWLFDARMTWPALLFFTLFISAMSFMGSFIVNFLVSRLPIHH